MLKRGHSRPTRRGIILLSTLSAGISRARRARAFDMNGIAGIVINVAARRPAIAQ